MRKLIAGVAAGLAMTLLVGCGNQQQAVDASKKRPEIKASPGYGQVSRPPLTVDSSAERQNAVAAQTRALADAGRITADVNADQSRLNRLFDNQRTPTSRVASLPTSVTPVAAPSQAEIDAKRRAVQSTYRNSPLGRSGDKDAPRAGTLPAVPLPDPSAASGDPNVRGGGKAIVAFDAFLKRAYNVTGKVFSRAAWHAAPSRAVEGGQNPVRVTIHHTDGKQTMNVADSLKAVRNIQEFHQGPQRGWGDIGYHFVVDGAGNVFEGRHADIVGAHVYGHNTNNLGIANLGDYTRDYLTDPQKDALKRLISFLALKYMTNPDQKGFIEGHHHFQGNNTDCPGPHIDSFLPELRALVIQTVNVAKNGRGFTPMVVSIPGAG